MATFTAIDDPTLHFQVVTYSGNGAADNAITLPGDTDMQPDVVLIKNRDATDSWCLFNTLHGVTVAKHIDGSSAGAADADTLDAFQSDGFRVDADDKVNTSGEDYVAYCWKMGTTSGLSGSPSITMVDYSFNQTAGQSIVQWSGTDSAGTVAHGLGVVPHVIWIPFEGGVVYHHRNTSAPETDYLMMDTNAATNDVATFWNDTAPTSTLTTVGGSSQTNGAGGDIVMYSFKSIRGYSKFGTYTGNAANAIGSGTFVHTGFRPAMVITKKSSGTGGWYLIDNRRPGYNINFGLFPHVNSVEDSSVNGISLHANGFSMNTNDGEYNAAATYIYMAWAEAPFVNSEGVPGNAR